MVIKGSSFSAHAGAIVKLERKKRKETDLQELLILTDKEPILKQK